MTVTRETTVKDALESFAGAAEIFERHGIEPAAKCSGMYDMVSLDDAEEWCKVHDVDGLIEELNAALSAQATA